MTAGRKALCQWITEVAQGKPWRRNVTIKEILQDGSAGRTYTYLDCFPTSYKLPSLDAAGTNPLYEEVTLKPIRLELS